MTYITHIQLSHHVLTKDYEHSNEETGPKVSVENVVETRDTMTGTCLTTSSLKDTGDSQLFLGTDRSFDYTESVPES